MPALFKSELSVQPAGSGAKGQLGQWGAPESKPGPWVGMGGGVRAQELPPGGLQVLAQVCVLQLLCVRQHSRHCPRGATVD